MASGIYCIINKINNKMYIGQTGDLQKRKREHFSYLRGDYHDNTHLQNSYNKYGKKAFIFKIILYCEPFELTRYEQMFVNYYTPEILYNTRLECVDSNLGVRWSEEIKRKMSKGRGDMSGENNPFYGKHHTEEAKRKISKALSGKKGHIQSEETRRKISEAQSGENGHTSKATKREVLEILDLYYNKKMKQKKIAELYPINKMSVSNICNGKTWKLCYKKFINEG